jgi:hypothetical protein
MNLNGKVTSRRLAAGGALMLSLMALAACGSPAAPATPATSETNAPTAQSNPPQADLAAIKTYLIDKGDELRTSTAALKTLADRYYDLAHAAKFDYAALWSSEKDEVVRLVQDARAAWMTASPLYEQMEGIVAGTPSLAEYDVVLDAGASKEDGGDNVALYNLNLPDGRTIEKPGNLFGVNESALWGTFDAFTAQGVQPDFNADGTIEFGEALPDANVLKAAAGELDRYAGELLDAAKKWAPTESDAFTALVVMVPTMEEYFASWKDSRFVAGDQSTQRDFVAISRLADIQDILSSLQVVHGGVSPLIQTVDGAQDSQIKNQLADLKQFVADVHAKEQSGKRYTAEEADTLGKEAQDRATAITGQIAQMAAKLNVKLGQ